MKQPPDNPAGAFEAQHTWDEGVKQTLIRSLAEAPELLRRAVAGLSEPQLDTRYKNWTVRQIVHHVADSHVHSYIRFRWTLTEEQPTIKAYEEADWVLLADCESGDVEPALCLLDGLHMKWVQMLTSMTQIEFAKTFIHPQSGETVSLWSALNYYPWHAKHHTAQIRWLRQQNSW